MRRITLTVNGEWRSVEVKDNELLLDVLRNRLHEKSIKASCWRGECGLCTVLLNGLPVKSCMVLAVEADDADIKTAEYFAGQGELAPVQKSFIQHNAMQCGFCTPAFSLVAHHLLESNPDVTREEIKEYISGLICRCTGYKHIVDAIEDAKKYYKK
jgi:carbon-monoxide dehydrogenase small subunit